jgi:hypothetical protein
MDKIKYTLSTFAVEGLVPSQTAIDYMVKVEQGRTTLEEAVEAIKCIYKGENKK